MTMFYDLQATSDVIFQSLSDQEAKEVVHRWRGGISAMSIIGSQLTKRDILNVWRVSEQTGELRLRFLNENGHIETLLEKECEDVVALLATRVERRLPELTDPNYTLMSVLRQQFQVQGFESVGFGTSNTGKRELQFKDDAGEIVSTLSPKECQKIVSKALANTKLLGPYLHQHREKEHADSSPPLGR